MSAAGKALLGAAGLDVKSEPDGDEEEGDETESDEEDEHPGELAAMKEFDDAKDAPGRLRAMKNLIALCK